MCLLTVALAIAAVYALMASRVHKITDNDGAYYFGVARHMALTHRFEEPIVWHFIQPPETLLHAPFDYWGCMTALLLVPSLAAFGAQPETAFATMAAISAASVLAFWYLICIALPLRYRATQLLALVMFAFSPAMDRFRFQPESTAVAQLFILLALIAFCRRRLILAIAGAFFAVLARGDALILFGLVFLAVLFEARMETDRRPIWQVLLAGLSCVAIYVLWSVMSFATLTPPGQHVLPFLRSYAQVFDFGVPEPPSWSRLLDWFRWSSMADRIASAYTTLRAVPFAPAQDWWLAIALLPAVGLFRRRPRSESFIWLLCFAGYFLVAWTAGPGFNPQRAPHTFTPLVILAGALGVDVIVARLDTWAGRSHAPVRTLLASAGVFTLSAFFLAGLPAFYRVAPVGGSQLGAELARLDDTLSGEPVASNVPWYVIAYTHSAAVSIPSNGEAAIEAVLDRYRVRWMVISGLVLVRIDGESRGVLQDILAGTKANVGRFHLERVPVPISPAVYRVHEPSL